MHELKQFNKLKNNKIKFKSEHFILAIGDNSPNSAERKHLILSKVPRSRAYRSLKNLDDSRTLQILGREHSNSILSGVSNINTRKNSKSSLVGRIFSICSPITKASLNDSIVCHHNAFNSSLHFILRLQLDFSLSIFICMIFI